MLFLLIAIFLFSISTYAFSDPPADDHYYNTGLQLYQSGNVNAALTYWIKAYHAIDSPRNIDPRIGTAVIQAVGKHKLSHLYHTATKIYYWSLSSRGTDEYREYLLEEIQKLAPVFDKNRFKDIERIAKKDPYKAAGIVLSHWESLDPTPETLENERLIEHGERIAYSKTHFSRNDNTVFGTDDRTLVYLRYGKPDFIDSGFLDFDEVLMKRKARELMGDLLKNSSVIDSILYKALHSYYEPEFEIWVYLNLTKGLSLVKIFGQSAIKRQFTAISSISDFVPKSAYRKKYGKKYKKRPSPGALLLYSYSKQLMMYHTSFADFFHLVEKNIPSIKASWVNAQSTIYKHELRQIERTAPVQHSTHLQNLIPIDVESQQYLLYDKNNTPYYLAVMNSFPQPEILYTLARDQTENLDRYHLNHNISVTNFGDEAIPSTNHIPLIPFNNEGMLHPAQSIFNIPATDADLSFTYSAQLYDQEATGRDDSRILPASLRARGSVSSEENRTPGTPTEFTLSDIIIGYQTSSSQWDDEIPFTVSINEDIPDSTNLFMHFQAINLETNESGISKMEVEFYVQRRKGFLKKLFTKQEVNRISVNLDDYDSQIQETLEIDLVDREPGDYELVIEFTDSQSGETIKKSVNFTIVDTSQKQD
ncbi:MAG: GWxTD domain-containing protein [Balneolaceae bacterium]|nr:GWxTD domain-containing protein [Balneolaceae bacterium]